MENTTVKTPISIKRILKRFNIVLFITILVSGLIFSIFVLNHILTQLPTNFLPTVNRTTLEIVNVDQATIDQFNKLKTSDNNTDIKELPSGRINPFSE